MDRFSIFFAGDNFARTCKEGADPYEHVRGLRETCQAAFCNLETVLTDRRLKASHSQIHIRTHPENVDHLTGPGGFDAVSLANNHILDYGRDGLKDALSSLDMMGIPHTGAGLTREDAIRPAIVEIDGTKVAFIGMAMVGAMTDSEACMVPLDIEVVSEAIGLAREAGASVVICSPHWGYEYVHFPTPEQQTFGRKLIDAGADLVVGHHPHVVQGIETYKGRFIFYSLGNFNFTHAFLGPTHLGKLGAVARVAFEDNAPVSYKLTPFRINEYWQPVPLPSEEANLFQKWLAELSEPLAGGITWKWWMRRVGRDAFRGKLLGWFSSVSLASGMSGKMRMLGRFAAWFAKPATLRFAANAMRSLLIHPGQRYIPPQEFREFR